MQGAALVLVAFAGTVVVAAGTVALVRWLSARDERDSDTSAD